MRLIKAEKMNTVVVFVYCVVCYAGHLSFDHRMGFFADDTVGFVLVGFDTADVEI